MAEKKIEIFTTQIRLKCPQKYRYSITEHSTQMIWYNFLAAVDDKLKMIYWIHIRRNFFRLMSCGKNTWLCCQNALCICTYHSPWASCIIHHKRVYAKLPVFLQLEKYERNFYPKRWFSFSIGECESCKKISSWVLSTRSRNRIKS